MFRTSAHSSFPDLSGAYNMVRELSRVKLYDMTRQDKLDKTRQARQDKTRHLLS